MVGTRVLGDLVDVDRYPIDRPDSDEFRRLVERCRSDLAGRGMYELDGFLDPDVVAQTVAVIAPRMASESSEQRRRHNIYFLENLGFYGRTAS